MKKLISYILMKSLMLIAFLSIITGSFEELSKLFGKEMKLITKKELHPYKCMRCGNDLNLIPNNDSNSYEFYCVECKKLFNENEIK